MSRRLVIVPARAQRAADKSLKRCALTLPEDAETAFRKRATERRRPLATTILDLAWTMELQLQREDGRVIRSTVLMGGAFNACSNVAFQDICHLHRAEIGASVCPFEIGPYECTLGRGHRPAGLHVSHGSQGEILAAWNEDQQ